MRHEVFRCRSVMLSEIAFQACFLQPLGHILSLESTTYGTHRPTYSRNCVRPPNVITDGWGKGNSEKRPRKACESGRFVPRDTAFRYAADVLKGEHVWDLKTTA